MRPCLPILLVALVLLVLGGGAPAQAFTGSNSTPITGPSSGARGPASPYPSEIEVSDEIGRYGLASVTLHGVTTTAEADMDVMLVSPSGERLLLVSDAGGGGTLNNATLTFADDADQLPATRFSSGTYAPTDIDPSPSTCPNTTTANDDDFSGPAPQPTVSPSADRFHPMADAFFRSALNGTWKLYVMDDCNGDTVAVHGGWTLNVEGSPGQGVAVPAIGSSGPASRYPIDVPISGQGSQITKVTAALHGPQHTHPDDLDVLLVGPTGASTLLLSDAGGDNLLSTDDGDIYFDDDAPPAPDSGPIHVFDRYRPTDYPPEDFFPAPAPPGPYGTALSAFNGTDPNGTWRFFLVDDAEGDVGGLQDLTLTIQSTAPGGQPITISQPAGLASLPPKDPADVFPPKVKVLGKDLKKGKAIASGQFGVPVKTDEASRISSQALLGPATARGLHLPPNGTAFASAAGKIKSTVVAAGSARTLKAGTAVVHLRFTRAARRALRRSHGAVRLQLRTRVTDTAGNRRLVKTALTLKP